MDSDRLQFQYSPSLNNVSINGSHSLSKTAFSASERNLRNEFFSKEECLYSHQVFLNAAKLFDVLKHDTKEERENVYLKKKRQAADNLAERLQNLPRIEFGDDGEKRLTLELAFTTLKCKYHYIKGSTLKRFVFKTSLLKLLKLVQSVYLEMNKYYLTVNIITGNSTVIDTCWSMWLGRVGKSYTCIGDLFVDHWW